MKLDLQKVKQYKEFLEKMLEKSGGEELSDFTSEEKRVLGQLIPGFDFQISEEDKRFRIIGAIEAAELLLDEKMQQKLTKAKDWEEVDRIALNVLAARELGEYKKNQQEAQSVKREEAENKQEIKEAQSVKHEEEDNKQEAKSVKEEGEQTGKNWHQDK